MRAHALPLFAALSLLLGCGSEPDTLVVGVSWAYFQEERWHIDASAIETALTAGGARYIATDAQASSEKQITDIESLVARGADVLVVVPHDAAAIAPALALARAEGIPVVAYDRLIEAPGVFYLSFDNREVGRLQARAIHAVQPEGRYVFIKGAPTDPNAGFVHAGQLDVLGDAIARGEIEVVGEQSIDAWLPELAQRVMEQILTATDDRVDAVVCSNDGMASGVAAALRSQGLSGVPLSGQDGDHAALNRVARGDQTVSVWKDARALGATAARVALELAAGAGPGEIDGATRYERGPRGLAVDAILLEPVPITRDNLDVVIDAGWVPREVVCRAVGDDPPPACR
ncbi:MAG: substrate-binding domain-containing protein [Deltaproteobacteria bacterium]|nr:substrate-binding domain-containing protein [Deltaproteobacteria bacterium]MBW2444583.1 substrate-binding domain-containing protein [Deltaproteobacteria bacterium]